jgi:hypothetical protein
MDDRDFPEDILWDRIISNLRKQGMTPREIARETGFTEDQVWAMGKDEYHPNWKAILQLLDLHLDRCGLKQHNYVIGD